MVKEEDRAGGTTPDFSDLYAIAGYAAANSYSGIHRNPYSTDLNRSPLKFRHIVEGVALPLNPAPATGANGVSNSVANRSGEIWAGALWECYAGLLNDTPRLTFDEARTRMKNYLACRDPMFRNSFE